MPFASRVFQLAKDPEHPEQCQDAWALDAIRGIAAVADGVATALFSRQWAGLLAEAAVAEPLVPDDKPALAVWLAARREAWAEAIDTGSLAWFQKAKLPQGAFSTLLWAEVTPEDEDRPGAFGAMRLRASAIGDSCLFHVRHGETLRTFPVEDAAALDADPIVLGSVDLQRDALMEFTHLDVPCYADDLVVLCTDAVAEWAFRQAEGGSPPDWNRFWDMSPEQWCEEVAALRLKRDMRYDDATLLLLRVTEKVVEVALDDEGTGGENLPRIDPSRPGRRPPPLKRASPVNELADKLKHAGDQVAEGIEEVSDKVVRGVKKLSELAREKYRDAFGKGKKKRK